MPTPETPICDYEGSDYQASFWEQGGRDYEDRVEAIALKRLLPGGAGMLLELGAGAGRNTVRYRGFERIVLLDFSRTQLQEAQSRLGRSTRYTYVAADVYRLPFVQGLFDAATMIRVLHHMADAPRALRGVHDILKTDAVFILEFANKRNLKSIIRFALGLQPWNPFRPEPIEFARLNFDFHPRRVEEWLTNAGFRVERRLTVSHFRSAVLKRLVPRQLLVAMDSLLQPTGDLWQFTPSVFVRARGGRGQPPGAGATADGAVIFKCLACGKSVLQEAPDRLVCGNCGTIWGCEEGIYDFRKPLPKSGGIGHGS